MTIQHDRPQPTDDVDEPGLDEAHVPKGSRRDRLRSNPATRQPYRVGVFVLGLLCIALGLVLAVLPGPLTIPPVLLGLWIWSWEFRFAQELFDGFKEKADAAWAHARRHPVSSGAVAVGGLLLAAAAITSVVRFELDTKAMNAIGL